MARLARSRAFAGFTTADNPVSARLKDEGEDTHGECIAGGTGGRGLASCRVDDKLSYKLNTSGMKMHYPGARPPPSVRGGGRR